MTAPVSVRAALPLVCGYSGGPPCRGRVRPYTCGPRCEQHQPALTTHKTKEAAA